MATNFSPCKGSYVLNQFPSNVMFGMNGFHVSASGAIQGHHGPLVLHGRKHCWKSRKCWLPAFSPFTKMFSKGVNIVKNCDCVIQSEKEHVSQLGIHCYANELNSQFYSTLLPNDKILE